MPTFALRSAARAGILAAIALGGCRALTGPGVPDEAAFLRGPITRAGDGWGYLVEGTPGPGHREDKAYFTVGRATILRRDGGRAEAADLVVGRVVSLWITGPIRESYPVQVDARVIVLEPEPTPAR